MDLFEQYSGRLRVAEANAEVVIEIEGVKYEVGRIKWTSRKLILYLGSRLDRRLDERDPIEGDLLPVLVRSSDEVLPEDVLPPRRGVTVTAADRYGKSETREAAGSPTSRPHARRRGRLFGAVAAVERNSGR